jgi:hypothetical protein
MKRVTQQNVMTDMADHIHKNYNSMEFGLTRNDSTSLCLRILLKLIKLRDFLVIIVNLLPILWES